MLFLNKQKREEAKMFDELIRKVKDSKNIDRVASTYDLIYKLDSINIAFNVGENFLKVQDKAGNFIVNLDCKYGKTGLSKERHYMFSNLLYMAQKTHDKLKEKEKKEEGTRKAKQDKELTEMVKKGLRTIKGIIKRGIAPFFCYKILAHKK
ncbi:MAG: hypothetical protein IKL14_03310 [Alphaproteobacteria bacterium]|nr:hypothetical protein [Alphaproteobacteria bacterium]